MLSAKWQPFCSGLSALNHKSSCRFLTQIVTLSDSMPFCYVDKIGPGLKCETDLNKIYCPKFNKVTGNLWDSHFFFEFLFSFSYLLAIHKLLVD